jgi:hypothetical protein
MQSEAFVTLDVMAGFIPAIPLRGAPCQPDRDHRDKPGDDISFCLVACRQAVA